ncbi:MAG: exodeoxyribonuclease VII large subunit [Caldilineaceae bacterium]|nr:exodeoxyribonuclease VII large subunit [Caldilineaceae bacterium]
MTQPIPVSTLNLYISQLFERDEMLRDLWIIGEVSNWKRAASGHVYFSLKDTGATLNAVMWKSHTLAHTWLPHDGDQIIAHGYVGVYPERGQYQLYVNRIQPAGRGQLYAEFEALKARLASAGLFELSRKRPLRIPPQRIGIITSADAAALRDILRVLVLRWPLVQVLLFPTLVQGNEAPAQIVAALRAANQYSTSVAALDTLILARGGGSIEDLWAFNDERVAYALFESACPVVTGIGHETDFTIADFVADLRAPTPSAAAATVTPDRNDGLAQLAEWRYALGRRLQQQLQQERQQLSHRKLRLQRTTPDRKLDRLRQQLDDRIRQLHQVLRRKIERQQERTKLSSARLTALAPHHILRRGYSIVQRADGAVVRTPAMLTVHEPLTVHSSGGSYQVAVTKTE